MYPGDAYVDWTCLYGYNWGTNPAHQGKWETFRQLYRETYRHVTETVAPTKPMMLAEIASSEFGGSKAIWIREMLSQVPTEYPKIRALLWFERFDDGMDWPLETSGSATTAFAESNTEPGLREQHLLLARSGPDRACQLIFNPAGRTFELRGRS